MWRFPLVAIVLGAAAWLGGDAAAQAQLFGGNRYGSGTPYYGGFGFGPGPGSNYMVPGYPYYGTGRPSNLTFRGGGNYVPRNATVRTPSKPVGDGLPIEIVNPTETGTALSYQLNGAEEVLAPGGSQLLTNDQSRIITFDRGGNFGTARYTMSSGQYRFELTPDHGWELFHDADVGKIGRQPAVPGPAKNVLPMSK
jgi:hypothetical protein